MNNNLTLFIHSIIWLEKYIEQSNFFSDWEQRKQTNTSFIKWVKPDTPADLILENLGTCLLIKFGYNGEGKDKWIDATKINSDCPKKLKLVLISMHEIYKSKEGGRKLLKSAENSQQELEPNSPEYKEQLEKTFSIIGEAHASGEAFKVDNTRFQGSSQAGKIVFKKIANSVSTSELENFHFWPQESDKEKAKNNQKKIEKQFDQYFSSKTPKKEPKTIQLTTAVLIISGTLILSLIGFFIFWYYKKNERKKR